MGSDSPSSKNTSTSQAGSNCDLDFESMKRQAVLTAEREALELLLNDSHGPLHLAKSHTVQNLFGNHIYERQYADEDGNIRATVQSGQTAYILGDTKIDAKIKDEQGNILGTIDSVIDFSWISRNTVKSSIKDKSGREIASLHSDVIDGLLENWLETKITIASSQTLERDTTEGTQTSIPPVPLA